MSTYKSIKGKTIQSLGTDPSDTGAEGQIWYNSTSGTFKSVVVSGAWSTGGNLGTATRSLGGAGTQTAGLAFGGFDTANTTTTQEYDGSTWGPGGAMGTARRIFGYSGTQTAALAFGGFIGPPNTAATEEYDGSTWTAG